MPDPSIFASVINSYLPEPHATLLNGIIFGISTKTSPVFYQQLKIVGLLHIVVLSGINITLLAAIVTVLTTPLGKKVSIFITMVVIVLFILFVGAQPPIVRAGFMGVLSLIAILYGRRNIALYGLILSAIFVGIFWPQWLKTVSFQLSYGATLGIILFGKTAAIKTTTLWGSILSTLWKEIKPSIAAQIFTAPLIFFYFKQVSLISIVSNVAVAWVIPPLMVFGFLTAILGKINFGLGLLPSYICFILLHYIVFVVEFLSKVPFAFFDFSH